MKVKFILLFLFQIIAHISLVWAFFNFGLYEWLTVFFIYFLTGCIGVSITLHRYYSHKSFKPKYNWLEKIGSICSVWGLIGSPISWVNNHRAHHRHADKQGDPHSPFVFGYIKVQWLSMFYTHPKLQYVNQMVRDPFHRFLHRRYYHIHALILLSLLLIGGWYWATLLYLAPAAILWNAGSSINTLCHSVLGYTNHKVNDYSKNNVILGYLVWGEGWHNNHHYRPANKNFQIRPWEFDVSYQVIRLIEQ